MYERTTVQLSSDLWFDMVADVACVQRKRKWIESDLDMGWNNFYLIEWIKALDKEFFLLKFEMFNPLIPGSNARGLQCENLLMKEMNEKRDLKI